MRKPKSEVGLFGLLAVIAIVRVGVGFDPGGSIDFYQFWAVSTAREVRPDLPPPYVDPEATRIVLEGELRNETDASVLRAHRFRMGEFEPFGSPLLYLAFAPFPRDYRLASALFAGLQGLCFALGVAAWMRLCGWGALASVAGAALLLVGYRPFGDDLFTGNLNSIQLAGFAMALALTGRACDAPGRGRTLGVAGLLVGLAALSLAKANFALAAAALAAHLAWRLGARAFLPAIAVALPGVTLLLVAPCLYFRSATVWLDWVRLVFLDPATLSDYALAAGNTSTPRLLEEAFGIDPLTASAVLALLLVATLAPLRRRILSDPRLAVGLAIAAVFALTPLVWFHYFVLALLPGLWLLAPGQRPAVRALGAIAVALYSAVYAPLVAEVAPSLVTTLLQPVWSISWIPLWAALLWSARYRYQADPKPRSADDV